MLPLLALAGCVEPPHHEVLITIPEAQLMRSVPVFGGTLESVPAVGSIVSADPENNLIRLLLGNDVVELDLGDNARPFRIHVEETTAWVTLRGTGELVEIDLGTMTETWRTPVCGEARGVARSPNGPIVVACADGPVVEVGDDGEIVRAVYVATDLRDIVSRVGLLWVSRFRSAEVLAVRPGELTIFETYTTGGQVAWRMRPDPLGDDRGVAVLHQRVSSAPLVLTDPLPSGDPDAPPPPTYYGTPASILPCGRLHESVVTRVPSMDSTVGMENVRVATDFAVSSDGALAFSNTGGDEGSPAAVLYELAFLTFNGRNDCLPGGTVFTTLTGRPSAVAFDVEGALYVQTAGPFGLERASDGTTIATTPADDTNPAHEVFHQVADQSGVACASCHPEGLDDGFTWTFGGNNSGVALRRTMTLAGSLRSREPYHWDGQLLDPAELMADTYVLRMGGLPIDPELPDVLFDWLDGLRPVRGIPLVSDSAVERGRELFVKTGCPDCHGGPAFTNNELEGVRLHVKMVKTPSLLGVGTRSPLFHDGCAATLEERFEPPCDDQLDLHGTLSDLFPGELEVLTAYLRTL